jgi:hypothetical protein
LCKLTINSRVHSPRNALVDNKAVGEDHGKPLRSVQSLTMSPDQTSVYTTSMLDSMVVHWSVVQGRLVERQRIVDGQRGVEGLGGAYGVEVSRDGRSVYVTGYLDQAIVLFSRAADGSLTFVDRYDLSAMISVLMPLLPRMHNMRMLIHVYMYRCVCAHICVFVWVWP